MASWYTASVAILHRTPWRPGSSPGRRSSEPLATQWGRDGCPPTRTDPAVRGGGRRLTPTRSRSRLDGTVNLRGRGDGSRRAPARGRGNAATASRDAASSKVSLCAGRLRAVLGDPPQLGRQEHQRHATVRWTSTTMVGSHVGRGTSSGVESGTRTRSKSRAGFRPIPRTLGAQVRRGPK
jgi:hypothetical protein